MSLIRYRSDGTSIARKGFVFTDDAYRTGETGGGDLGGVEKGVDDVNSDV